MEQGAQPKCKKKKNMPQVCTGVIWSCSQTSRQCLAAVSYHVLATLQAAEVFGSAIVHPLGWLSPVPDCPGGHFRDLQALDRIYLQSSNSVMSELVAAQS